MDGGRNVRCDSEGAVPSEQAILKAVCGYLGFWDDGLCKLCPLENHKVSMNMTY